MTASADTSFNTSLNPDYSIIKSELSTISDVEYGRAVSDVTEGDISLNLDTMDYVREKRQRFFDQLAKAKENRKNDSDVTIKEEDHGDEEELNIPGQVGFQEGVGGDEDTYGEEDTGNPMGDTTRLNKIVDSFSKKKKSSLKTDSFNDNTTQKIRKNTIQFQGQTQNNGIDLNDTVALENFNSHQRPALGIPHSQNQKILSSSVSNSIAEIASLRSENKKLSRRADNYKRELSRQQELSGQLVNKLQKYKRISVSQKSEIQLLKIQNDLYKTAFESLINGKTNGDNVVSETISQLKGGDRTHVIVGNIKNKEDNNRPAAPEQHEKGSNHNISESHQSLGSLGKDGKIDQKLDQIQVLIDSLTDFLENSSIKSKSAEPSLAHKLDAESAKLVQETLNKYVKRKAITCELADINKDENLKYLDELVENILPGTSKRKQFNSDQGIFEPVKINSRHGNSKLNYSVPFKNTERRASFPLETTPVNDTNRRHQNVSPSPIPSPLPGPSDLPEDESLLLSYVLNNTDLPLLDRIKLGLQAGCKYCEDDE